MPSVAVVIATLGRPDLVQRIIDGMAAQSRRPDLLVFSICSDSDLPIDFCEAPDVQVLFGPKGLPAQRNTALDRLRADYDLIVFYDDDFVPSCFSIERIAAFFAAHSDVAGACGDVLADGIGSSGISEEEAVAIVSAYDRKAGAADDTMHEIHGLYGCNMVYRSAAIGATRFDERLKLYGWLEDVDFSAALTDRGRIVRTRAFAGVHQGVKHGRTPGKRLGYSQMINPLYLTRKRTVSVGFAAQLMFRNFVANHVKMFWPEPWIDRKGRAKGNWIGLSDALRGKLTPERIENL